MPQTHALPKLVQDDPYLNAHADVVRARMERSAVRTERLPADVSQGHTFFGFTRGTGPDGAPGLWYREWAPGADHLALVGDFNGWDGSQNPLTRGDYGAWSLFLPDADYADRLGHDSAVKVRVTGQRGIEDRIPAYIRRATQDPTTHDFVGRIWKPEVDYVWRHTAPKRPSREGLRIYEAHVGMASEEPKVARFDDFRRDVLPTIPGRGYNAVQLMAVQEHPYYGSFGYHVSNLFAVSSRFGTPDELKRLIDDAHGLGLTVIMDIVHSHMVKNTAEGLSGFDGTGYQYFHTPPRGDHPAWDSRCFDYKVPETLRLLLSNVRFWLEEYHFDGLRFDGVTSMLYLDHGLGKSFTCYDDYFGGNVDEDAVTYLMLANDVAHAANPNAITIAEDVSGMPGVARPTVEGGLGFDYRLAMSIPDQWIKLLKEVPDEGWNLNGIMHELTNRRRGEKHIGYAESHDQALVGDKTTAMWLFDEAVYTAMNVDSESVKVDRGVALHKLIRLMTFSLAGEGYLNFMGNEFGHPEWIDFPREGNGWSCAFARRQWSLGTREDLRYGQLGAFDVALMALDQRFFVLEDSLIESLAIHDDTRQLIYRRGPLVFAVNLHPTESYVDLRLPVPDASDYRLVLSSDDTAFGGHGRVKTGQVYAHEKDEMYGREQTVKLYLPTRTAVVLAPV
ncbi:MAG: alpha amylase C-terminal domain-containing protein [Algisphaera sp.]